MAPGREREKVSGTDRQTSRQTDRRTGRRTDRTELKFEVSGEFLCSFCAHLAHVARRTTTTCRGFLSTSPTRRPRRKRRRSRRQRPLGSRSRSRRCVKKAVRARHLAILASLFGIPLGRRVEQVRVNHTLRLLSATFKIPCSGSMPSSGVS